MQIFGGILREISQEWMLQHCIKNAINQVVLQIS